MSWGAGATDRANPAGLLAGDQARSEAIEETGAAAMAVALGELGVGNAGLAVGETELAAPLGFVGTPAMEHGGTIMDLGRSVVDPAALAPALVDRARHDG